MQLINILSFFSVLVFFTSAALGQETSTGKETEIDFLFSYYQQDGDSSAVTGGKGTEELHDYASSIIINIPLGNGKKLNLQQGVSYYTSASSDNIDPSTVSSASYENYAGHLRWSYSWEDTATNTTNAPLLKATIQNNFIAYGFGYAWSKFSADNNTSINFSAEYSHDKWAPYYKLSKLYPREIRFYAEPLPTDTRQTVEFAVNYTQVINAKMQALLGSGMIYQWGLLSTPFHRVYFNDSDEADLERLPVRRYRIPVVLRWNYYANDFLVLRTYYRFYTDNFDINSHTIKIETPIKLSNFFSVYPYYRFYVQTASKYFAAYKQHDPSDDYYTSDFDLSAFSANMLGGGIRISPPLGIRSGKVAHPSIIFKEFEFRYGKYWRSNGLEASIVNFYFSFLH